MIGHEVAPSLDVLGPGEFFVQHDLVVAGVCIEEDFYASGTKFIWHEAGAADVQENIGALRDVPKFILRHPEMFFMAQDIVPFLFKLRGVFAKETLEEIYCVGGIIRGVP